MEEKKTHIALIGVGLWGKNLLKEFSAHTDVTWVCHKGSGESATFLTENYPNIPSTTSYADILNDSSVEAVVVATPTVTHFEIGMAVLQANKHLFLEKPGCTQSHELEQLCVEAEKRNLVFTVGYEFVHHPARKKISELIGSEAVRNIHAEWFKWGTFADSAIPHLL